MSCWARHSVHRGTSETCTPRSSSLVLLLGLAHSAAAVPSPAAEERGKWHIKLQAFIRNSISEDTGQHSKHLPAHFWFHAKRFWPKLERKGVGRGGGTQLRIVSGKQILLTKIFIYSNPQVSTASQLQWKMLTSSVIGTALIFLCLEESRRRQHLSNAVFRLRLLFSLEYCSSTSGKVRASTVLGAVHIHETVPSLEAL